jgi:type I restriction enzyme S subunit
MFGDPVANPKGWETKTIDQLVKKEKYSIKRGPFGGALKKEVFVERGYLVYEQFHALNNDFNMARYFIDEKKFNELKAFEVKEGDLIISCSGVYLGKLAIVPNGAKKGIINQALLKITLDDAKMNSILFIYIFSNKNFRNKYFGNQIGSGIPNFPAMPEFKKFKFIYPPIELQNQFALIVEETKAIKQKMLTQAELFETQFQSRMQKAFLPAN